MLKAYNTVKKFKPRGNGKIDSWPFFWQTSKGQLSFVLLHCGGQVLGVKLARPVRARCGTSSLDQIKMEIS